MMGRKDPNAAAGAAPELIRCYELLDLAPGSDASQIKKAYRTLALVWHPDRFAGKNRRLKKIAEERFKQLNAAYQTLMAASAAGRISSTPDYSRASHPSGSKGPASPDAPVRRPVPAFVCMLLLAVLCAGFAVFGYRYLRIERAHRDARARLEISEQKKEALLALAANRSSKAPTLPHPDRTVPGSPPPAEVPSLPASRVPDPGAVKSTPRPGRSLEPDGIEKERRRIEGLVTAAESLADQGRYREAQDQYRTALSRIAALPNADASIRDLERHIKQSLDSARIRLGAAGYHLYGGRWFSPEEYRTEFVTHRGKKVHYTSLKGTVERFADPLVRSHLRAAFSNRLIHKNQVSCTALRLLDNRPSEARLQVLYRWEVWTFEGVEEGNLTLDLVYHNRQDRWEAVWLTKGSPSSDGNGSLRERPASRNKDREIKEKR